MQGTTGPRIGVYRQTQGLVPALGGLPEKFPPIDR
jgi:hypothetical protein